MRRQLNRWGVAAAAALVVSALVPTGSPAGAASTTTSSTTSASVPRDGRIVVSNLETGQIETLNPDGTAVVPVSPPGETGFQPSWSPDGSHIAFASDHAGDPRIFVVRANGTGMQQITDDPEGWVHNTPTYTPDGQRIIFTRCRPDPPGGCALFSIRTNGQDRHAVTAYDNPDKADFLADVSPDGARVAFARFNDHGILSQVWVARIDGSHAHAVTTPALEAASPEWTKDGHHLLVTSNWQHVGENVYRVRDDGSQLTKLTARKFPHNAEMAAPSPSGAKIVYSDDQAFPGIIGAELFVMNPDGSGKHAITSGGRLLDADWGTAPLIKSSSATSPYATAKASTSRQPAQPQGSLSGRLTSRSGSHKWSR